MTDKEKPIVKTVLGFGYRTSWYKSRRNTTIPDGFEPVPGYEERWVNRDGVVWGPFGRQLVPGISRDGYSYVAAKQGGKWRSRVSVHRLVAMTYCHKPAGRDVVNHINGIKADNRAENLEWVTPAGNVEHAVRTGLTPSKLTDQDVLDVRAALATGETVKTLAARYGVSDTLVYWIGTGRKRKNVRSPDTI